MDKPVMAITSAYAESLLDSIFKELSKPEHELTLNDDQRDAIWTGINMSFIVLDPEFDEEFIV